MRDGCPTAVHHGVGRARGGQTGTCTGRGVRRRSGAGRGAADLRGGQEGQHGGSEHGVEHLWRTSTAHGYREVPTWARQPVPGAWACRRARRRPARPAPNLTDTPGAECAGGRSTECAGGRRSQAARGARAASTWACGVCAFGEPQYISPQSCTAGRLGILPSSHRGLSCVSKRLV